MEKYSYCYNTKIGPITIVEQNGKIIEIRFGKEYREIQKETIVIQQASKQLEEYFAGRRKKFTVEIEAKGTAFQQQVWEALRQIPYGETRTYGQIAQKIGNVNASRAVGMANNKNPIPIIIPCHRVIGSNGKLIGYAGGLDIKEKLLEIENTL